MQRNSPALNKGLSKLSLEVISIKVKPETFKMSGTNYGEAQVEKAKAASDSAAVAQLEADIASKREWLSAIN
jgi:hypothetical protein